MFAPAARPSPPAPLPSCRSGTRERGDLLRSCGLGKVCGLGRSIFIVISDIPIASSRWRNPDSPEGEQSHFRRQRKIVTVPLAGALPILPMPELTPNIVDAVVAACQAAPLRQASLQPVLDSQIGVSVGQHGVLEAAALPEEFTGPGLVVLFKIGMTGAVLVLPESSGLVPAWCAEPDATGQSKLATLRKSWA